MLPSAPQSQTFSQEPLMNQLLCRLETPESAVRHFSETVASASSVPRLLMLFGSTLLSVNQRALTVFSLGLSATGTWAASHPHPGNLAAVGWGMRGPELEPGWISLRGGKKTALLMNALAKRINMLTPMAASYGFIKKKKSRLCICSLNMQSVPSLWTQHYDATNGTRKERNWLEN